MTGAGAWAGLFLLLASPDVAASSHPSSQTAEPRFAPPCGQVMTYRVTTRRVSRSGALISFSLVYALEWREAGRGYRLDAVLQRIESDARPELLRALTGLMQPLVGERLTYLVDAEGRSVILADRDELWAHVAQRSQDMAAGAKAAEARQASALLMSLPEAERDRLLVADVRALVMPGNASIPAVGDTAASIRQDGPRAVIVKVEKAADRASALPIDVEMSWMIDTATGLVLREQRQSWLTEREGGKRTLVEERVRALEDWRTGPGPDGP